MKPKKYKSAAYNMYDEIENAQVEIKNLRNQAKCELDLAEAKVNAYNKSIAKLDTVLKKYVDYSRPLKQ